MNPRRGDQDDHEDDDIDDGCEEEKFSCSRIFLDIRERALATEVTYYSDANIFPSYSSSHPAVPGSVANLMTVPFARLSALGSHVRHGLGAYII